MNRIICNKKRVLQYNRLVLIGLFLVMNALTGCGKAAEEGSLPIATGNATLPPSATPTETPTPSPTPAPKLPVQPGTPIPLSSAAISSTNMDQVVELALWGKGVITDATYSPDGKLIAIATTLGISIFQADTLEENLF